MDALETGKRVGAHFVFVLEPAPVVLAHGLPVLLGLGFGGVGSVGRISAIRAVCKFACYGQS